MGCSNGCFSCSNKCEDFFKQFQSDWTETNDYSPSFIRNKLDSSDFVTTEDFEDFENEIIRVLGNPSDYTNIAITLLGDLTFRYGIGVVFSLANLPVSKQSVVANLSANSTLSLSSDMKPGQVINIEINPSVALKVTLPLSANWIHMDVSELDLSADQTAEINIWCTGNGKYSTKTIVKE
ncbi:MAG: hypothetical protein LBV72_00565 [Tannerella sp.]|jgi:hypothetical protein|nr:hypothetical protein [Tannerella sp.]